MSLRENRLKYSIAGDATNMADANSAPSLPMRPRSRKGIATSAIPATAYSSRDV